MFNLVTVFIQMYIYSITLIEMILFTFITKQFLNIKISSFSIH